jgi:hypothetical protein
MGDRYEQTLHIVKVGDVMPATHFLVKRYRRRFKRGDK